MTVAAPQYVVSYEGKLYGPFATNDASANANTNDAAYWSDQQGLGGGSILVLYAPAAYAPPFPITEESG